MPANLTPEFLKARERFHRSRTPEEKLVALEDMLRTIPKHKGTDHMVGDIRRQIAKFRDASQSAKKGKGGPAHDHVAKEGAGQVVLVGPPNSGKSSLVAALTNARPEIADYPFSTLVPVPGMMQFEDVRIQIVDLPPLSEEYTEPWVYSLIRAADVAFLVLAADEADLLEDYLDEILAWAEERRIQLISAPGRGADDSVTRVTARIVLNKADLTRNTALRLADLPFPGVVVSARTGSGLDDLRRMAFDALGILRIYTKLPGKKPDLEEPYTLPIGSTALDAVRMVHRDLVERLKYVRVWGSGRFDGQQVPSEHRLADGDIVEIHAV
ncbi:MAG: GTPase [Candidatus Bipolaricaulota bacterium]